MTTAPKLRWREVPISLIDIPREYIRKAPNEDADKSLSASVKLSKAMLVRDIARLKQNVKDQRSLLKLKRTHLAIGPQIYGEELLQDKKLLVMLEERKINWRLFMEAYQK